VSLTSGYRVEPASWDVDRADLEAVRRAVFIVEQAIPEDEEWDALDARSRHVVARDAEDRPIGTARLTPDQMIGRVAVLREWRGRGVGEALMQSLVGRAREVGYPAIELHAQTHAIPFYARLGFETQGDEFMECGIPHRLMRLALAPAPVVERTAPTLERPEARTIAFTGSEAALAATLEIIGLARRELCLVTRDLDPDVLDTEPALAAFKRVGLAGRAATVRILVLEPARPLHDGHRLIHLARRLPSVFQFRTPLAEEDRGFAEAFLLNDRHGYCHRPLGSRYEGEAGTWAPTRAAPLQVCFDRLWERSAPSEVLRQLSL